MGLKEHFASYLWTPISRTLDLELPRYEPVLASQLQIEEVLPLMIQAEPPMTPVSIAYPAPLSSQLSSPPPSSIAPSSPGSPEDTPNTTMAPERTTGRGPQTAKIARIKFSPYPKLDIGEALELCFGRKSLRGGAGVIHPNDARDGKFLFCNSIKDLLDMVIKEAVLMKHAAWELREAEHYSNFMKYIYQANCKKYGKYLGDGQGDVDLDHAVEIDNAENFLAFGCEVYNKDIMMFQTMNTWLDQLEEEVQCCVHDLSSKFDGSLDCNASDRYVESGVNDSKDGLMGPVDST
ncbi:hypothetical protein F5J12DRAFT_785549 [Pisolithus orientalis]|uniref:uncharacterized protein n=1 Tax=Pisolithus orientalis TaxID=936130 RepID=UPI002224843A|nr:uncharacterized protein F5J12DRAFT_785546 [Pisolithus orientalis]XP_051596406.1 uncharacterized protein F5J12DRAFT_785549 [Pisolithus orientalis]KAI5995771.1 hypothetical protein F5J12DRAFT_785546 [Pisolithus orientalis]KAI5995778.1 hypothetical protein F5J12DRAFT_785549 [Pisolithus orientalis]